MRINFHIPAKSFAILFCLISAIFLSTPFVSRASTTVPDIPKPTPQQLAWQEMETYAFLHYSINTYTGEEWGYGNESVELFNPDKLDVRQWVKVCKDAGMKGIILTAKHHAGFCLWPSKFTEYSVKNSPWKNGEGDIVKDLAEACKEEGMKFAVYLSPWDRNYSDYGNPEYVDYFRNQLEELLTGYGEMFEVWFDGANGGTGWYGGADERRKIDASTYYDWENTYPLIRKWQPDCMIWNSGGLRGDLRWVGTEQGFVGQPNWSMLMAEGDVPREQLHHGLETGDAWVPAEVNTSIRPGWFYHEKEDSQVKTLAHLMDIYYKSVGRNASLLLNFPVRPDGLIDWRDSVTAVAFGKYVEELTKENLASQGVLKKDEETLYLQLPSPVSFDRVVLQEDINDGQRIKSFSLEAMVNGSWLELNDELLPPGESLSTIGYKRIICVPETETSEVRLVIKDSRGEPTVKAFELYKAPPLVEPLPVSLRDNLYLPTNAWSVIAPGVSELEWRKAIDPNRNSVYNMPSGESDLIIDMKDSVTFSGFSFMPSVKSSEGLILDYALSISDDGENWKLIKEGEFSNIENNPIRQTVETPLSSARYVKFSAKRLAAGDAPAIGDFKLINEKVDK